VLDLATEADSTEEDLQSLARHRPRSQSERAGVSALESTPATNGDRQWRLARGSWLDLFVVERAQPGVFKMMPVTKQRQRRTSVVPAVALGMLLVAIAVGVLGTHVLGPAKHHVVGPTHSVAAVQVAPLAAEQTIAAGPVAHDGDGEGSSVDDHLLVLCGVVLAAGFGGVALRLASRPVRRCEFRAFRGCRLVLQPRPRAPLRSPAPFSVIRC
jgi:hypothetical protein